MHSIQYVYAFYILGIVDSGDKGVPYFLKNFVFIPQYWVMRIGITNLIILNNHKQFTCTNAHLLVKRNN